MLIHAHAPQTDRSPPGVAIEFRQHFNLRARGATYLADPIGRVVFKEGGQLVEAALTCLILKLVDFALLVVAAVADIFEVFDTTTEDEETSTGLLKNCPVAMLPAGAVLLAGWQRRRKET